jgi:indolepyruvate ferredoxin oxidoreductase alpha subunit
VRAAGVEHLEVCDPYDMSAFTRALKQADSYIRSDGGSVAVVISRRPCVMDPAARKARLPATAIVNEECLGCGICVSEFECPAVSLNEELGVAVIDQDRCIGCGVCIDVCPAQAIEIKEQ